MYKVLFAFDSMELVQEIKQLPVWEMNGAFEITKIVRDGESAYRELKKKHYDLVFTEIEIPGRNGLALLRSVTEEKLCERIVLCSKTPSFDYARKGIVYGAYDYMVYPFDITLFHDLFQRIETESIENMKVEADAGDEILELFRNHDSRIYNVFPKIIDHIYNEAKGYKEADKVIRTIYVQIIESVFQENEWLSLYVDPQELYRIDDIQKTEPESHKKIYSNRIIQLYDLYNELLPNVANEAICKVMKYILYNPENDLKEKEMASMVFMNTTFFSTAFATNTGQRFVDYLLNVRLFRAAFFLKNSKLKITEISLRICYKDTGYFSRLFKKKFGVTPTEYRMPDNLEEFGG